MGRAGISALFTVAVVLGLATTASADEHCSTVVPTFGRRIPELVPGPHVRLDGSPTYPNLTIMHRELVDRDVATLGAMTASYTDTAFEKITLIDLTGDAPTQILYVEPGPRGGCDLPIPVNGVVLALVEDLDHAGHASPSRYTATTVVEGYSYRGGCGLGATVTAAFEWFFVIALFAIISFVAIMRRIRRGTHGEAPIVISLVLAETLARRARSRDGVVAGLVMAAGIVAWTMYGNWVVIGSVWILLCIGDYWVATHAVSILERPHAVAELYGTNLVVRAEDHTSAILLTRHAIKSAKRDALPRALLQYDFAQTTRCSLGSPVNGHVPGSPRLERDAAHGDLEVVLDLRLERRIAVEVRHREAAVDRRRIVRLLLRRIGEERVELVLGVDHLACARRGYAFARANSAVLDLLQHRRRASRRARRAARPALSFGALSRRPMNTESLSMSRGPTSRQHGTPFLIHSHTFSPPRMSRTSSSTRTGAPA